MGKSNFTPATGLFLPGIVFILFLILKLTGSISWSWWWVTSPLWIVAALCVVAIAISTCYVVYQVRRNNKNYR